MSFMLFLRGFLITLIVFALATYALTQSFWTTLINTVICAVVIQVGYFLAILVLVGRDKRARSTGQEPAQQDAASRQESHADGKAKKPGAIGGLPRSGQSS